MRPIAIGTKRVRIRVGPELSIYFILFALKVFVFTLQCLIVFGGKTAPGTARLGFRFGLGFPDNPSLNLKSRKENR